MVAPDVYLFLTCCSLYHLYREYCAIVQYYGDYFLVIKLKTVSATCCHKGQAEEDKLKIINCADDYVAALTYNL